MTSVGVASSLKLDSSKPETLTSATTGLTSGNGAGLFSALLALLFGGNRTSSDASATNPPIVAGAEVLRSPGAMNAEALVPEPVRTGASEYLSSGHALPNLKRKKLPEMNGAAPLALPTPILANTPALVEAAPGNGASRIATVHTAPTSTDVAANALAHDAADMRIAGPAEEPINPDTVVQTGQAQFESSAGVSTAAKTTTHLAYSPPPSLTESTSEGELASAPAAPMQTPVTHVAPSLKAGAAAISSMDADDVAAATVEDNSNKESTTENAVVASASAPRLTSGRLADNSPSQVPKTAAPVADQLTNQIGAHLDQLRQLGHVEIQLDLHPPELGRVQLHLAMDDGRVNVRMLVQDDAVKRLMDLQLTPLRVRFAEMGVRVGQFDVRRDGSAPHSNHQPAPEPSLQPIQPARAGPAPARKAYRPLGNTAGSVDVIA
jgi:flagellar hook-length control protein FliK